MGKMNKAARQGGVGQGSRASPRAAERIEALRRRMNQLAVGVGDVRTTPLVVADAACRGTFPGTGFTARRRLHWPCEATARRGHCWSRMHCSRTVAAGREACSLVARAIARMGH
ncbi:hypothetical protein Dimus_016288 [Dionaea muscipula]